MELPPPEVSIDNHQDALSVWLDLFRWAASFAVLLYHVRHRLFLGIDHVPPGSKSVMLYGVGVLSGFGAPAVLIFFVLSGFLVGGGSLRRFRSKGLFDLGDYLLARLTRLWIVLIPVFGLTIVLNMLGADAFGGAARGIYGRLDAADAGEPGGMNTFVQDPATLACNITFLQTALCEQFGGNGALWSLFNEFWYYLAWPPLMLALWARPGRARRPLLVLVPLVLLGVLSALQFIGAPLLLYFSLWLAGVVAADRVRPLVPVPPLAGAALLIAALLLWRLTTVPSLGNRTYVHELPINLLIAFLFANLIMTMKAAKRLPYPPLRRLHQPVAGFSFTLYCLHTPLIHCLGAILVAALGTGWQMMPVGPRPFLLFAVVTMVCLAVAWAVAQATERHTVAVRRFVQARLPRRARA